MVFGRQHGKRAQELGAQLRRSTSPARPHNTILFIFDVDSPALMRFVMTMLANLRHAP